MFGERHRLPVFERKQLYDILEKVGLLKEMTSGKLLCSFCKKPISEQNFGALFVFRDSGKIGVSCNNPQCLKKIAEAIGE